MRRREQDISDDKTTGITYFDRELSEGLLEELKEWLKSGDESKSRLAGSIIFEMLKRRLEDDLSPEGLEKIRTIVENLNRFEGFIEKLRTDFDRKIYRDHLNHMIRTTIIASYLARLLRIPNKERNKLEAASLFHDACYPIEEASHLFDRLRSTLSDGYSPFAEFQEFVLDYKVPSLKRLSKQVGTEETKLRAFFEKPNHAIFAASQFLRFRRPKKGSPYSSDVLEIAAAICLHDSRSQESVIFYNNPLAAILVIADELQDWGRPVSQPDGKKLVPLTEISDFLDKSSHWDIIYPDAPKKVIQGVKGELSERISQFWEALPEQKEESLNNLQTYFSTNYPAAMLKPTTIQGGMNYDGIDFPLLDVVCSKHKNLKRLENIL